MAKTLQDNARGAAGRGLQWVAATRTSSAADRGQQAPLLPWILGLLPSLKRVPRRIADVLLKDPEQFISSPISRLAGICEVSKGSIVLFCKSLGLKGLPALKITLARELAGPVLPHLNHNTKGQHETPLILQRVYDEHYECLQQTLKLTSAKELTAAADTLHKAQRILLFSRGLSYPVAYFLYVRLRFLGLSAFIEADSHVQLCEAAGMRKGDVAIGISASGKTRETIECICLSKDCGAKVICITNSIDSPLARAGDIALYAAPSEVKYFQSPLVSRVAQLALVDALLVLLGIRRKRQALRILRHHEEVLLPERVSDLRAFRNTRKR
jgi:DNA-binding MurR/RpiR family transcriptional regulator